MTGAANEAHIAQAAMIAYVTLLLIGNHAWELEKLNTGTSSSTNTSKHTRTDLTYLKTMLWDSAVGP